MDRIPADTTPFSSPRAAQLSQNGSECQNLNVQLWTDVSVALVSDDNVQLDGYRHTNSFSVSYHTGVTPLVCYTN